MTPDQLKDKKRVAAQAWREANRERHRAYTREYRRKHAAECARKNREWALANPELVAGYHRQSRRRNPEGNLRASANWRKNNVELKRCLTRQRRARLRAVQGTITRAEWLGVMALYGPACLCCGKVKPLSMDHIKPISLGGPHSVCNVQPLCRECNSSKGTKEIDYRFKVAA